MEKEKQKNDIAWHSATLYVDIDTGLLISKKLAIRDYIILRKTKKYEIVGKEGIIKYTNECERDRQQKLW